MKKLNSTALPANEALENYSHKKIRILRAKMPRDRSPIDLIVSPRDSV